MKTVADLITRIRRETRNLTTGNLSAGSSIDDAEFIDMLNDAQELCVELISGVFSRFFESTTILSVTANDEEIDLPTDVLLGTRIASVEFTYDSEANYYNLKHVDIRERQSSTVAQRRILSYARSGNKIILMQKPTQAGSLRLVYEKTPIRLDEDTDTSELPDACEKYLVAYSVLATFERDGSKLAIGAEKRFNRIADSLLKSYIQEDRDFPAIPDTEY